MLNDNLANVLSHVLNCEKTGKTECKVKSSLLIKKVLQIMQENTYIGGFSETVTTRGSVLNLSLIGAINKCGVIKPRHAVGYREFVKFEKRYLPAKEFGILIVSTPKGIMIHSQARENKIGGKLLAFCY
jgi:small subunit ribosomal protein S8